MQPIIKKIQYILLCCVAFTMPFSFDHLKFNSYFIILLLINSILLFVVSKREIKPLFSWMMFLFVSAYLIHLAGLYYSDNSREATFELQKKLGLLLFPILLFYSPKIEDKQIRTILLFFVLSCLCTMIFCFSVASYYFLIKGDKSFFFYHNLSGIVGMHAVYLAMYLCFSIAILLYLYFNETHLFKPKENLIYYSCIFILIAGIVLLSARIPLLMLLVGIIIFFILRFYKKIGIFRSILGALGIGVFILGLVFLFPKTRERFKEAIKGNRESLDKHWGWAGSSVRELQWTCAVDLIKSNPLTGVGTGDVQNELDKNYAKHGYVILLYYYQKTHYNAHNQFLQIAVGQGIAGLILLLLGFVVAMVHAVRHKKTMYVIFIILFVISCLTESMLERQHGVVFYAFFNSLFAFHAFSLKTD